MIGTLPAQDLLKAWEQGDSAAPFLRALLLLGVAHPDRPVEELARLSIGQRDALLLDLREKEFGPMLAALANCPSCGEVLELGFRASDIKIDQKPIQYITVRSGMYVARFRLPDSNDLSAIQPGMPDAREIILARCLLSATRKGVACSYGELPNRLKESAILKCGQADPQADVQLALDCPACHHHWKTRFDILSFLWVEVDRKAKRLMQEVHLLASAYGWRESDILALTPRRREVYLNYLINR